MNTVFIVSPETISKICQLVAQFDSSYPRATPADEGRRNALLSSLGKRMLRLNHEAMHQRYGDEVPAKIEFFFEPVGRNLIECCKAAECWLYQCQHLPRTKLLDYVDRHVAIAYESIVKNCPDYERAQWG